MDLLSNLDPERLFSKIEQKAPMLGNLYGVLGPLAATSHAVGDSPLNAIMRELMALTNPKMPTIDGIIAWWNAYAKDTAKNGVILWLVGELLGKPRWGDAGWNILKGTALAAVIGEVGQGGGAPYGNPDRSNPSALRFADNRNPSSDLDWSAGGYRP